MSGQEYNERRFLSLRWKAAFFLAPIILFSELLLIGTQYNDLTRRFQIQKEELQTEHRQYINSTLVKASEQLVSTAMEIYDLAVVEQKDPLTVNLNDIKSSIDKVWFESSRGEALSSVTLIDKDGQQMGHWGEPSNVPMLKWTRMVITNEAPVTAIHCQRSCAFYAGIPVMVEGNVGGTVIVSRAILDFIFEFNSQTGDDIGIITVQDLNRKNSKSNIINSWQAVVNALTNKAQLFPIIDDLSKKHNLEKLSEKGIIFEKDELAYSILTIPISKNESTIYLMVLSDISSDYSYIKLNIKKMIFLTIVSTMIVLVIMLFFLWKPIAYLQKQANILPLLAKGEFDRFRSHISHERFKIDPFNDELDTLDQISLELSNQLERLEKEIQERAHELEQFGLHDTLTGLPNRRHFIARLKHALLLIKRNHTKLAVMFLDIDHFKRINDSLGHESGDQLLIEVSRRLEKCIRKSDTIARLGGDEFTVIVGDLNRDVDASLVAKSIIESIRDPITIGQHQLCVTTSIGIAVAPDNGENAESLLRYADLAMYKSKGLGRDCYHFYTPSMHHAAQSRMELENELRTALEQNEFQIYLQVQVDLGSNRISGFEALIRWNHRERGLVSPDKFVPILEDTGLIVPVGEFVLREACNYLKIWLSQGFTPIKIAINISPRQFQDRSFSFKTKEIITESGLPPELIELEITETLLMDDVDKTLETLMELRTFGVSLAIDDFGTGYSSLGYLYKFPVQYLKIDREFLKGVPENYNNAAITSAVIAMAHKLNISVIAEGVETIEQIAFLREHECNIGQGYFFSKPLPFNEFLSIHGNGQLPDNILAALTTNLDKVHT